MRKEPVLVLIQALFNGAQVKYKGNTWVMGEDGDIGIKGVLNGEEKCIHVGMTFKELNKMANDIPFDDLFIASCEGVLSSGV